MDKTANRSETTWLGIALLGAACLFVGVLVTSHPALHAFQLNKDEGYNWMKARLVADGHLLYEEIWSDQPPAFTWMLAGWCRIVGWDLPNTRLFMLFWSGILIFSVGDILRRECGLASSALGMLALICSQGFLFLSVALMIGLPAIASAMFAIWAISKWYESGRIRWVVLAGGCFGISLSIKLFTGFLIPIVITWLIINGRSKNANRSTPAIAFLVAFAIVLVAALIDVVGDLTTLQSQLLGTHLEAHGEMQRSGKDIVPVFLRRDMALFVLGILGCVGVGRQFPWKSVPGLFVVWLVIGTLVLLCHRPVWSHHALLLTVPASVLCGVAWKNAGKKQYQLVSVIVLTIVMGGNAMWQNGMAFHPANADQRAVLKEMARFRDVSRTVVVDSPIFCAHLGLRTPAELAVSSRKRFSSGRLDVGTIVSVIKNENPEQVLLSGAYPRKVHSELSEILRSNEFENYVLIFSGSGSKHELFVRRDVLDGRVDPAFTDSVQAETLLKYPNAFQRD